MTGNKTTLEDVREALDEAEECFQPETMEALRQYFPALHKALRVYEALLKAKEDGWRMVPGELTDEMWSKGNDVRDNAKDRSTCFIYGAMLEAAPKSPVDEVLEGE